MASHPFIESNRRYMMFPLLIDKFLIHYRNWTFRRKKNKVNGREIIEIYQKISVPIMRLVLIGKHAHRKGNIRHVRYWSNSIASNFRFVFFTSKMAKIEKDKCSHCTMALDYSFHWLSTVLTHRTIALWVHLFTQGTIAPGAPGP